MVERAATVEEERVTTAAGSAPATVRIQPPRRAWWKVPFQVLGRAAANFVEDRGTQMAAAISYYALFSLFPLAILAAAIFGIVLRDADVQARVLDAIVGVLPVEDSSVADQLRSVGDHPALRAALDLDRAVDPRAELESILRELYDVQESHHRSIKLIDRAVDHPELGSFWQTTGRVTPRTLLARYIESRIGSGQFRKLPDVRLGARIVIEVIATWAMHIKWDPTPEGFEPAAARESAIAFLISGLLPDP